MIRSQQTRRAGHCRKQARRQGRASWLRAVRRAGYAVDASWRLIHSSIRIVNRCERTGRRRPVGASRELQEASARLSVATDRLLGAARQYEKIKDCIVRDPRSADATTPAVLVESVTSFAHAMFCLERTSDDVSTLLDGLVEDVESGLIRPEPLPELRPRIHLKPRPAPIRTFLEVRQPRLIDRIAPVLRRRRRTPCPAEVRVPRRSLLGRAPPLVSIALV